MNGDYGAYGQMGQGSGASLGSPYGKGAGEGISKHPTSGVRMHYRDGADPAGTGWYYRQWENDDIEIRRAPSKYAKLIGRVLSPGSKQWAAIAVAMGWSAPSPQTSPTSDLPVPAPLPELPVISTPESKLPIWPFAVGGGLLLIVLVVLVAGGRR